MTPPPSQDQNVTQGNSSSNTKRSANDFIFGKVIGEGSFSTVYLAKDIHTKKEYAIKVCEKRHIIREKKVEYVKREKEVLNLLSDCSSYFVRLYCTFQDKDRLYFVLTYAKNADLLYHLTRVGSFSVSCTRYYAAEILLGLEILHSKGIIHRDLKPENILLDDKMHILITDFGSAKILTGENQEETNDIKKSTDQGNEEELSTDRKRKNSFVGTAQYVSPEILTDQPISNASDLWAFGCIIYQMISGLPPFRSGSEYLIFQKILKLEYEFPEGFETQPKDLVEKLLQIDPKQRLGADDVVRYKSIRDHAYFKDFNFDNLGEPPMINFPTDSNITMPEFSAQQLDQETGLNDQRVSKLQIERIAFTATPNNKPEQNNIASIEPAEITRRLDVQKQDKWHQFVENNLILKKGLVDKRKGLFARRRMLLLTQGPHLYYVDPNAMVLKGEIPWTAELRVEPKNFKVFFVHTPNRTYYLEDPEGYALNWCKTIEEVHSHYFPKTEQS